MTTETLTCPYCNASLGIQAGWSAGQRITCPRCGDSFPLPLSSPFLDQPSLSQPSEPSSAADTLASEGPLPTRWSNRLVAGVILGVMFFMASSSLVFMLLTQQQRRAYDTSRPPRRPGKQRGILEADKAPPGASVTPDKLAALGYLPSGVNFLLAVRISELLASPLGTQLLREPIQWGDASFHLNNLLQWLGFRLEEIDHLLLAARIDDTVPPPFYVVLRTAQPYDPEQLRQRLKGSHIPSSSKKKLYVFRIPQQDMPLYAWFADERTVVLALLADHLETLPSQPVDGLQQLPEELRTFLKQHREPTALVWSAGHCEDWSKTAAALLFNRMKKEQREKLASLRTFAIFIIPAQSDRSSAEHKDNALVVKGAFACKEEAGAREWAEHCRALCGPGANLKTAVEGPSFLLQCHTSLDFFTRLGKR